MSQLRAAVATAASRADAVLESSDAIAQLAITRAKTRMVKALLEDDVLSSLYLLSSEPGHAAVALGAHTRWLKEHLGIEPLYEPGHVTNVHEGKLTAFHMRNPAEKSAGPLHRIAIVASGWKQGTKVLRPPVANFVRADQ